MSAKIIDGEAVATRIREEIKAAVEEMDATHGMRPGLALSLIHISEPTRQVLVSRMPSSA